MTIERELDHRSGAEISEARGRGVRLALAAAGVSGVSIFLNSFGVKSYASPTVYTTAKNLVAAVLIGVVASAVGLARRRRAVPASELMVSADLPSTDGGRSRRRPGVAAGILAIAIVGGSVPFVLFFEGLARSSAKDAAFLQKTLVVWVAVLAVVVLRERLTWWHLVAIAGLVAGQALLGVKLDALRPGGGELMILAATMLWAVEVVLAKRLLTEVDPASLAFARMGLGAVVLVGWLAVQGRLGELVPAGGSAGIWVFVTGITLGAYVLLWYAALARAGAIDVTAVLVLAVVITAVLDDLFRGVPVVPQLGGLALVVAAGVGAAWLAVLTVAPPPDPIPIPLPIRAAPGRRDRPVAG